MKLIWILLLFYSCVTPSKPHFKAHLPTHIESLFVSCKNSEGAFQFWAETNSGRTETSTADWSSQKQRWQLDVSSPLGDTLIYLNYLHQSQTIEYNGALSKQIPSLESEEGWVIIDGYHVGLLWQELPCFFKYKLPQTWRYHMTDYKQTSQKLMMKMIWENRQVTVTAKPHADFTSGFEWLCQEIKWDVYWGMSHRELKICYHSGDKLQAELSSPLFESKLYWVYLDE